MIKERVEVLLQAYKGHLERNMKDNPNMYRPGLTLEGIMNGVLGTLNTKGIGCIAIQTDSWKATCKDVGIRHSYKSISEYLDGL